MPTYWTNNFTIETWEEARRFGFRVTGFRTGRMGFARQVAVGDIFLCYLGGGVSRWLGALEVTSEVRVESDPRIWVSDVFPVRFDVKPLVTLDPETAIPVADLASELKTFNTLTHPKNFGFMFQGSPARLRVQTDGPTLLKALERAQQEPISRPILIRRRKLVQRVQEDTSAPYEALEGEKPARAERAHSEIQYLLLKLGSDLGLDVWVARNDRGLSWNGHRFEEIPRLRKSLPEQFDPRTQRIVELIDVLWLEREGIRCAFEIENSTNIYGGILRMSDLLVRRPHLDIPLYIVAPDDRYRFVVREVNRPTFASMNRPLVEVCKFIPYSALRESVTRWASDAEYLRPRVIDTIAQICRTDSGES